MASPTEMVMVKNKKSPSLSDSHHLFDAVQKGKIHLTRFILAASPNKLQNSWDQHGRTPLIVCCDIKEEGTRDQIVHILLESGADVNMTDSQGRTALIHACEKRCNDIVRILIHHHNVKPDVEDVQGNTALIYSAAVGNDVATELLVRNFRRLGLQVDHYNKEGNTAILVAARNGNLNCAKILAQKGRASLVLKDKERHLTALEWCLQQGYQKDEVEFLKPVTRFYRVAKLATSLSRSRSSVCASHSHDSGSTKTSRFSPSTSLDSGMSGRRDARPRVQNARACLGRSKSQVVDSSSLKDGQLFGSADSSDGGTCLARQHTVDVPSLNHSLQKTLSPPGTLLDCARVEQHSSQREPKGNGSSLDGSDAPSLKDSDQEHVGSDLSGESSDLAMIDDAAEFQQEDVFAKELSQSSSISHPSASGGYSCRASSDDSIDSYLKCKATAMTLADSPATSPPDAKADKTSPQQWDTCRDGSHLGNQTARASVTETGGANDRPRMLSASDGPEITAVTSRRDPYNGAVLETARGQTPTFPGKTVAPLCEAEKEEDEDFDDGYAAANSRREDSARQRDANSGIASLDGQSPSGESSCLSPDADWLPEESDAAGSDARCPGAGLPDSSSSGGSEVLRGQKLLDVSSA